MASEGHNFSGALSTWREINLTELQKTLDAQGIELVENQKESVVGRKALADKTKDFKKLPDDSSKLNAWKGLLKSYQGEIDALTKRAKSAESAFLAAYKVLAEAPDPYPLLEVAVEQAALATVASTLEVENASLTAQLAERAPLEAAKKKAEERLEQLESKFEERLAERVSAREAELDEKMRNYEEREQDLTRQLELTKSQVRDLRTSHESSQARLLDHTQRQDQEAVSKLAEVDMVVADLERANARVAIVEKRNEELRASMETLRSGSEGAERVRTLEAQVSSLESETERLSHALDAQKSSAATAEQDALRAINEAHKDAALRAAEAEQLRTKMRAYADYDEVKRELEIMKYVEFGGLEDGEDDWEGRDGGDVLLPDPNADKTNARAGRSLEALLASKNKRILEELTKFRIMHGELEASLSAAKAELASTRTELDMQRALCEKLESDLASMGEHRSSAAKPKTNGDVSRGEGDALSGLELGRKTSDTSVRTTPIPFTSTADTSILPIVTSQRDRFRQRNSELEDELRKQYNVISELRGEIKSLQADNLKLYEKVRYMQSYREEAAVSQLNPLPAAGSSAGANGGGARGDDLGIGKYRARYEEAMNPFEAFRGREATRAYQNLNVVERGVLVLTRSILGNRRARTAFIFYALALHVLVMFTTYECTTASSGRQLQTQPAPYHG